MKKQMALIVLLVSQVALAQVKPHALKQAHSENIRNSQIKEYQKAVNEKKVTADVKQNFIKFLNEKIKIEGVDSSGLELIASNNPKILSQITKLVSISESGTKEQKDKAATDLKILSEASKYNLTQESVEVLEKVVDMANYNENAKTFKAELVNTLRLGKAASIEEAVKIASNGKITLEKIKECIL